VKGISIVRSLMAPVLAIALVSAPSIAQSARQLTFPPSGSSDAWAVFSPRGDKVAFGRSQNGVGILPAIFVADIATGVVDTLVSGLTGFDPNAGLQWSPDGSHIAFGHDSPGVGESVWIVDVPAPQPSPLPHLVGVVEGSSISCVGGFAIDDRGRFYSDCGTVGYQIVGNLPGTPVSIKTGAGSSGVIWVGMENGDVYRTSIQGSPPYAFEFMGNVFTSAGITGVAASAPSPENHVGSARPNPFNPVAKIPYSVTSPGKVSVQVFDVSGRLVRTVEDTSRVPGDYTAHWDGATDTGTPAASGTYFCQVHFADGSQQTRKVTLAR
jgi:dipeptidyl aminopeptidase/acylaminoacyl peptidase